MQASPQSSHGFDKRLFQEMRWRSIGPHRGGRSLAVTGVRGQPELFYFGSVDGGVWRSNDAGRTWNPIFDSQPIGSIGAIAVAPSNPEIIYVGSGEADMRSDIAYGNGMYKSTDAGKTWTHIGLSDSRQIARILIDPANPNKVFVAALGHAYGPNSERGVFRSTDGGAHWERVLFHDENTGAIDLAFGPGHCLRRAAANAATAVEYLSALKRSRQRAVSFTRWRKSLGRPYRTWFADGRTGANWNRDGTEQSAANLFNHRCESGGTISLRRRRRKLATDVSGQANLATRLVF